MMRTSPNRPTMLRPLSRRLRRAQAAMMRRFMRREDGAVIIFGVMIFGLMLAVGGLSFDLMRYEAHRERLQSTLDRAVLAAASLTQPGSNGTFATVAERKAIVIDYMNKAGMGSYIDVSDITVTTALNSSRVEASATVNVPLHHATMFQSFGAYQPRDDGEMVIQANARSIAEESIGEVEISLVLDASGSMDDYDRMEDLKDAAQDFIDTIYNAAEAGDVTTSVVPYSTQVSAGETLLSYFQRSDSHDNSFCLNFVETDYDSTTMTLVSDYEQALHFDPWMDENDADWWEVGNEMQWPNCPTDDALAILPWSTNQQGIKDYIEGLYPTDNTSTDVGTKWGAALLDPSLQSVVTGMIATNDVSADAAGRPFNYNEAMSMKVMVVMTDGAHTDEYYMGDYRSGDSFVWKYITGDNVYYSIWGDGEGSEPDPTYRTTTETQQTGWEKVWYCDWYYYSGDCGDWDYYWDEVYEDVEVEVENWYVAYNTNFDGSGNTQFAWVPTPYDGDSDYTDNGVDAVRMTWDEVWAEIPPEYFSDEILWRMGTLSDNDRNAFEWAVDAVGSSTKNLRFDSICEEAKTQGVVIFTIGLEVSADNATRLTDCATTESHYYDVDNLDLDNAFQSIAGQINQLRLTQ
ncbi:MAG: pilus assembly protein TadG-related protein [Pseudomonadota bacterium]